MSLTDVMTPFYDIYTDDAKCLMCSAKKADEWRVECLIVDYHLQMHVLLVIITIYN